MMKRNENKQTFSQKHSATKSTFILGNSDYQQFKQQLIEADMWDERYRGAEKELEFCANSDYQQFKQQLIEADMWDERYRGAEKELEFCALPL